MKKKYKFNKKNFINKYGFTYIEFIVVIFIIAIISSIFLTNYHGTNKRSELIMAAQRLASDIRLTQDYSIGLKKFNNEVPKGGWGVHFTTSSSGDYIIFADIDGGDGIYNGDSEKYEIINLPDGINISNISIDGGLADISFEPPDPRTWIIDNGGGNNNSVQIKLSDEESIKTIEINFLGLIDVID